MHMILGFANNTAPRKPETPAFRVRYEGSDCRGLQIEDPNRHKLMHISSTMTGARASVDAIDHLDELLYRCCENEPAGYVFANA